MTTPRYHATPAEAIGELIRETVLIGDRVFEIERPANPDALFDHPWVRSAYAADGYTPYWATLWPSSRMLAKAILREPWKAHSRPLRVLEVGCGVGLAGIACLACGLEVVFTDVDATALEFAATNARRNGFTAGFATRLLDLRCPPEDAKYPVVIAADLMYEERLVDPLVELLAKVLAPGGVCLVADPDRPAARLFRWKVEEAGYSVRTHFARAGEPGGERTRGTLYRIWHEDASAPAE
jgi:predicted nicotinamide N-methyase